MDEREIRMEPFVLWLELHSERLWAGEGLSLGGITRVRSTGNGCNKIGYLESRRVSLVALSIPGGHKSAFSLHGLRHLHG